MNILTKLSLPLILAFMLFNFSIGLAGFRGDEFFPFFYWSLFNVQEEETTSLFLLTSHPSDQQDLGPLIRKRLDPIKERRGRRTIRRLKYRLVKDKTLSEEERDSLVQEIRTMLGGSLGPVQEFYVVKVRYSPIELYQEGRIREVMAYEKF